MTKDFIAWLVGIIEDYPLPYEVDKLYFCLHKEANFYSYISFGGNEFECQKMLFNFQYYPLDAQFFAISQKNNNKNFSLLNLRLLISKSIKNDFLKQQFANKDIFYGVYGSDEIYKLD